MPEIVPILCNFLIILDINFCYIITHYNFQFLMSEGIINQYKNMQENKDSDLRHYQWSQGLSWAVCPPVRPPVKDEWVVSTSTFRDKSLCYGWSILALHICTMSTICMFLHVLQNYTTDLLLLLPPLLLLLFQKLVQLKDGCKDLPVKG